MNLNKSVVLLCPLLLLGCTDSVIQCETDGSCHDGGSLDVQPDSNDPCDGVMCAPNLVCVDGHCGSKCGDAPRGCRVDPATCQCRCAQNSDCDPGLSCEAGVCEPLNCPEIVCEACGPSQIADPNVCCGCKDWCDADTDCENGSVCDEGSCEQLDCSAVFCDMCAPGEVRSPHSCCECIPQVCASSDVCAEGLACSTERGDCNAPPNCVPGESCENVCYGTCGAPFCEDTRATTPSKACRTSSECSESFESCADEETACGFCMGDACVQDADCPDNVVCAPAKLLCSCNGTGYINVCQPDCRTGFACQGDLVCDDATGACLERRCSDANACPPNSRCDSTVTLGTGCKKLTCANDIECDCGFCVNGSCQSNLGACEPPRP